MFVHDQANFKGGLLFMQDGDILQTAVSAHDGLTYYLWWGLSSTAFSSGNGIATCDHIGYDMLPLSTPTCLARPFEGCS